ncbi:hypothetical protein C8J56DRAFT_1060631 [Mycena floridula]|nr:hypothetical protein C8J56DRAFT_1060631 [Mycena floridula]
MSNSPFTFEIPKVRAVEATRDQISSSVVETTYRLISDEGVTAVFEIGAPVGIKMSFGRGSQSSTSGLCVSFEGTTSFPPSIRYYSSKSSLDFTFPSVSADSGAVEEGTIASEEVRLFHPYPDSHQRSIDSLSLPPILPYPPPPTALPPIRSVFPGLFEVRTTSAPKSADANSLGIYEESFPAYDDDDEPEVTSVEMKQV